MNGEPIIAEQRLQPFGNAKPRDAIRVVVTRRAKRRTSSGN